MRKIYLIFGLSMALLFKSDCPISIFRGLGGHGLGFFSVGQFISQIVLTNIIFNPFQPNYYSPLFREERAQRKFWKWNCGYCYRTQLYLESHYVSGCLFATHGCCQDLTDGTLTDEVTNSIPTDELTILSIKYGNSSGIIWWPDFQIIMQLLAKFVINASGVT